MNQLSNNTFFDQGLDLIVHSPTHKGHYLDKIFVSQPIYTNVKTITSSVKTEYSAIIVLPDSTLIVDTVKTQKQIMVCKPSPSKNAHFLASTTSYDWSAVYQETDRVRAADSFYAATHSLLSQFTHQPA